jgi:hypothetical protein
VTSNPVVRYYRKRKKTGRESNNAQNNQVLLKKEEETVVKADDDVADYYMKKEKNKAGSIRKRKEIDENTTHEVDPKIKKKNHAKVTLHNMNDLASFCCC